MITRDWRVPRGINTSKPFFFVTQLKLISRDFGATRSTYIFSS